MRFFLSILTGFAWFGSVYVHELIPASVILTFATFDVIIRGRNDFDI